MRTMGGLLMSYDGIVMRAVTFELNNYLHKARIDKIYQTGKKDIVLHIRQPGLTYKLLLSANAQEAGVYLIEQARPNPAEPPLFCMVLRKHLEGGKILSFQQANMERIMNIQCEVIDELGDKVQRTIIIEIMGKHSNIILLHSHNNKIIDSIQRVPSSISSYRQVLPGLIYQAPPPQEKVIPWKTDETAFYNKLLSYPLTHTIHKAVLQSYSGLGPQSVDEIITRANLDPSLSIEYCGEYEFSKLWQNFIQVAQNIHNNVFEPEVIVQKKAPISFSAIALTQYPLKLRQTMDSMNKTLDFYFFYKKTASILQQKKHTLHQVVKKELERCEKKKGLQLQTIQDSHNSEKYKVRGELLMANLHLIKQGKEAKVIDFFHPEQKTSKIPLDPNLSPVENAQRYFKKYQKSKHAAKQAAIQLVSTNAELEYLYSVSNSIENVTELQEVDEIKEELIEATYLKPAPTKKKSKNKKLAKDQSTPAHILIESWEIYWGKNNKQNDLLTMKIAKSQDIWFHTKDIPGSHVIIKNPNDKPVPENILELGAMLAAYHSKAHLSTNIPVDYTYKKHVWKIKGAKPGMVHYENQRTIYVTPDVEKIDKLKEEPL